MPGQTQVLSDRIYAELAALNQQPAHCRQAVREMYSADPDGFCRAALPLLREGRHRDGVHFLLDLLQDRLPLCDPAAGGIEDDIAIAKLLMEKDPLLDVKLARRIVSQAAGEGTLVPVGSSLRILEVLESISDGVRILPILVQLMREREPRLRSKAALIVGRVSKSPQWVEKVLQEPDARVRANSVEALWGVDTEAVRSALWTASRDANNRVRGNALLALYRLGDSAVIAPILKMATHEAAAFRATAAWVMAMTADPRFQPTLARMVRETDPLVRRNVFRALTAMKKAAERFGAAPRLRVTLCPSSPLPGSTRTLRAAIACEDESDLEKLQPTGLVIWEGADLVSEFNLRPPAAASSVALGIALPCRPASSSLVIEQLEQGVRACLGQMRSQDRCAVTRFNTEPPPDCPELPSADEAPPCYLTTDAESMAGSLATLKGETSYACALAGLLRGIGVAPGRRNLLLLEDRTTESATPGLPERMRDSLLRDSQAASVAIHAVILKGTGDVPDPLEDIVGRTGGICLFSKAPDQIAEICRRLFAYLLHPYEVVYRSQQQPAEGTLKLQVHTEQGFGEDALPLI